VLVVDSAAPAFAASEGDIRKSHYATGIKMSRTINNKEQRIVVLGDADFMSDMRGMGGMLGNAAYSWTLYNEYPRYANRPLPVDTLFVIGSKTAQTIFILYLFIIPGLTLLLGTIILIRRNRR
jgi:ABC-2 type transport system permease protein